MIDFPEAPDGYYWRTTLATEYDAFLMEDITRLIVEAMPLDREGPEARLWYCCLRPDLEQMKLGASRVQHLAHLEYAGARQVIENMAMRGVRT